MNSLAKKAASWGVLYCFIFGLVIVPSPLIAQTAEESRAATASAAIDDEPAGKVESDKSVEKEAVPKSPAKGKKSKAPQTAKQESKKPEAEILQKIPLLKQKPTGQYDEDHFELDYAPTDPLMPKASDAETDTVDPDKPSTPWYKHWGFWTGIGLGIFVGAVLIVNYGVDHSDSMSIEVKRRNP